MFFVGTIDCLYEGYGLFFGGESNPSDVIGIFLPYAILLPYCGLLNYGTDFPIPLNPLPLPVDFNGTLKAVVGRFMMDLPIDFLPFEGIDFPDDTKDFVIFNIFD